MPHEPDQPSTAKQRERQATAALSFAQCVDFAEPQILNSMFPAIQAALRLADSTLGWLTAAKRTIEIVSVVFWGFVSDRFNRRDVLAFTTLLGAVAAILTGLAPAATPFFILTLCINLGTAAMEGQTNSVLSDYHEVTRRGRAFGLIRGFAYSGLILALVSFSLLSDYLPGLGWRIAYFSFGGLGVAASLAIRFGLREPRRGSTEEAYRDAGLAIPAVGFEFKRAFAQFRTPTIVVDSVNMLLLGFPKIMLVNYSVTFFVKVREISQGLAILITLMGLIGFIAGSILGGLAGDRVGRQAGERARLVLGHIGVALIFGLSFAIFGVPLGAVGLYMAVAFLTAFCIEFVYCVTRVAVSSVLLPEVRTIGFAVCRVADSLGSIIASVVYALVVVQAGIGPAVLWLSLGGGFLAVAQYFGYYLTVLPDARTMQDELRRRLAPAAGPA